jgi:diguanylate cyclase
MRSIPREIAAASMHDKPTTSEQQSPADIAREAFRRLAIQRVAPTPEAYRQVYDEVAGTQGQPSAEKVLTNFVASLANGPSELARFAHRLTDSLKMRDWGDYDKHLKQLVEKHLILPVATEHTEASANTAASTTPAPDNAGAKDSVAPTPPLKTGSIPLVDDIAPLPAKRISIPLVDDIAPPRPKSASIQLVDDIDAPDQSGQGQTLEAPAPVFNDTQLTRMLREMLVRTLTLAVPSLLQGTPELTTESESLAIAISGARTRQGLTEIETRFKQFCFRIEMKSGDVAEEQELLLRLFKLLIENIGELVEDDSWLNGQIANVQEMLSGPINYASLIDATRSLKEVIYKQSLLKHSLAEAKARVKDMMMTVIDRLGAVATSTGDYHKKIEGYSQKISRAKGVGDLNQVLDDMLRDTRNAQEDTLRSQHDMIAARREVQAAETRIHELESELTQMSELAREDQLTGSLNRRGLDDFLEHEFARSERKKTPLCVALLDLDDFKRLNDTHGHSAGDGALIHLVQVIKTALRTMDIVARFGGEEFVIVLPHTPLEAAVQTVTRVQRELTKQIFMYNNERLLITFSAGVALRKSGEEQTALIARADEALYKAKKAGKNRVVSAD